MLARQACAVPLSKHETPYKIAVQLQVGNGRCNLKGRQSPQLTGEQNSSLEDMQSLGVLE